MLKNNSKCFLNATHSLVPWSIDLSLLFCSASVLVPVSPLYLFPLFSFCLFSLSITPLGSHWQFLSPSVPITGVSDSFQVCMCPALDFSMWPPLLHNKKLLSVHLHSQTWESERCCLKQILSWLTPHSQFFYQDLCIFCFHSLGDFAYPIFSWWMRIIFTFRRTDGVYKSSKMSLGFCVLSHLTNV